MRSLRAATSSGVILVLDVRGAGPPDWRICLAFSNSFRTRFEFLALEGAEEFARRP